MTLGEKIKNLRNDIPLSQKQLAQKLLISRSTLACYEINRNDVPNELLVKLAKFFNVSTDYLLGLTEE